ncbi:hypothetical protein GCM10023224_38700 [Streptomonospora halophila]|uniref:Uncharacterized protein n=1 Tax=Streptomonospora halophila TaxID=427369 RepID=A0ABP9GQG2_9ACTN
MAPVDPGELPGVYRSDAAGGEVELDPGGTFTATAVVTGVYPGASDFSGTWEFIDNPASDDFVYLSLDESAPGRISGIQLYATGGGELAFRGDPDGPPSMVLTKVPEP